MDVQIRRLEVKDAYTSVAWRNDKAVFKYTANTYAHEVTVESELGWIKKVLSNANEYRCAILADGVYVGNIYLTDITETSAAYHIFIGEKEYWGKGVGRKASIIILNYAFKDLKVGKVTLNVNAKNVSAIRLYEKLGFKPVGVGEGKIRMECRKCDFKYLNTHDF